MRKHRLRQCRLSRENRGRDIGIYHLEGKRCVCGWYRMEGFKDKGFWVLK